MSRRWIPISVAVFLLLCVATAFTLWYCRPPQVAGELVLPKSDVGQPEVAPAFPLKVVLYFPSVRDELEPELRTLQEASETGDRVEAIVTALLVGPEGTKSRAPLPPGVRLGGVYLGTTALVYVDLLSDLPHPPSTGSTVERLRISSLVESILENVPEVSGIVLLWNGEQPDTFGGHIDTSRPLRRDRARTGPPT